MIAMLLACSLLIAGCSRTVEGSAHAEPIVANEGSSTPATSVAGLSVKDICLRLLAMVDALGQLDPEGDRSDTLKSVFDESRSSSEWKTTPLDERHRIEEAFGRAESGRC